MELFFFKNGTKLKDYWKDFGVSFFEELENTEMMEMYKTGKTCNVSNVGRMPVEKSRQ